jgi:CBS domain-containing protein
MRRDARKDTGTVSDVMRTDVGTCVVGESLNRAAQLMWDRRCGSVPVFDRGGDLVGLLTDRDVAMAAYTQGRRLDDIAVETAMSRPAVVCRPTATIEDVENLMMAHAVRRLVVTDDDGALRGVVSLDDIARCGVAWDGDTDIDLERAALTLGEISRRTTTTEDEDNSPDPATTDVRNLVRNSLALLKTLRREVHVDLELAGQEVRDRWRRLEARLRAAELRAQLAHRGGATSLAALVERAKEFRRGLRRNAMEAAHPGSTPPADG